MVIVIDKKTDNLCYFPKNIRVFPEKYTLEIKGTSKEILVEVEDVGCYNNWYSFQIDFSDFQNGEYNYRLFADDSVISYGIIQVGDYDIEHKDYKKNTTYKQYNPN